MFVRYLNEIFKEDIVNWIITKHFLIIFVWENNYEKYEKKYSVNTNEYYYGTGTDRLSNFKGNFRSR